MSHQRHRGKNPEDEKLFSPEQMVLLRKAVKDLSYLYTRGYSEKIAVKVVGDHYQLKSRQRLVIQRAVCSDTSLEIRKRNEVGEYVKKGEQFLIDGYNLLITVESLLSGGILICGRDGCIRDIASLHGTYHKVEETVPAIHWIGEHLSIFEPSDVIWFLDKPISNSKRLAQLIEGNFNERGWNCKVEVVNNPDYEIVERKGIAISSDSWILDRVSCWLNFVSRNIKNLWGALRILDFSTESK
ncbi:MAG TPA: DUF434 domain-containing protein [Candidatus Hydrogenedens sp.]|nr:DUF434 domain-containing protein [Candidatus Hydrogenedens sp.]